MMSKLAIFLLALMAVVGSFPIKETNTTDSATDSTTVQSPLTSEWSDIPPQSKWSDIRLLYKWISGTGSNQNGTNDKDNEIVKYFDHMESVEEQMRRRDEELRQERKARERGAQENEDVRQSKYRNDTESYTGALLFVGFLAIVFLIAFMFVCIKSPATAALMCCDMCCNTPQYRYRL